MELRLQKETRLSPAHLLPHNEVFEARNFGSPLLRSPSNLELDRVVTGHCIHDAVFKDADVLQNIRKYFFPSFLTMCNSRQRFGQNYPQPISMNYKHDGINPPEPL